MTNPSTTTSSSAHQGPLRSLWCRLRGPDPQTRLAQALATMDHPKARQALDEGAVLDIRPFAGGQHLLHAARQNRASFAQLLIEQGVDPEVQQADNGRTPLLIAVAGGYDRLVKTLGCYPLNLDHRGHDGRNAWDLAAALPGEVATWKGSPRMQPVRKSDTMTTLLNRVRVEQEQAALRAILNEVSPTPTARSRARL